MRSFLRLTLCSVGARLPCLRRGGGVHDDTVRWCRSTPPPTVVLPDMLDMDEEMAVSVHRPYSEDEASQQAATRRFLRALITTPDEQEWKDMLSAAIRLNTWREHHIRAVVRSVHQTQYDDDCNSKALTAGGRFKHTGSTPAKRLQRAVGVVQTAVDEGYQAAPESVHTLLVVLLRAASTVPSIAASATTGVTMDQQKQVSQPPLTTHAAVWQFLAWMERNNYHIMTAEVLQGLERVVDDVAQEDATQKRSGSVRQNRLEYLRRERDGLYCADPSQLLCREKCRGAPPVTMPNDARK
ncbi:heat shock protein-like protein [Trypanosoma theileri]|uniref:Heat shock protein-like protein n=1 Tax=Trypanosoma theileri TaxID=67003 RepID=A0A1X0NVH2_9TRYP|nr:heat shock protein-like protein [Trypanosoma theileri]ORC88483.1 heat shock protein-like protein [Trypanosoma theileri]